VWRTACDRDAQTKRYIWLLLVFNSPPAEGFRWDDLRKIFCECQRMAEVPNAVKYAENYNRLSRVHERYRQTTDDRPTDTQTGDSI